MSLLVQSILTYTGVMLVVSLTLYLFEDVLPQVLKKQNAEENSTSTLNKTRHEKSKNHIRSKTKLKKPFVEKNEENAESLEEILEEIDEKLDRHEDLEECLNKLKILNTKYPEDPQMLWRIGKAYQKKAEKLKDSGNKKANLDQGIEACKASLDMNYFQSDAHKWLAVLIGYKGRILSMKEKTECASDFKKHLDTAISLNPDDPELQHMAGRFCFEISALNWVERKFVNTVFAEPLDCSFDIALEHFLRTEETSKHQWRENRLFIAKCYIAKGNYRTGVEWLEKAKTASDLSVGDDVNREINSILSKYKDYR